MSECTKCGTPTNNPSLDGTGMRATGPLETDEFNGIAWLCDKHAQELREWLREDAGTLAGGDLDIRHREVDTVHEYAIIEVGGHHLQVREKDGDPHLYLHDHATIRIEGDLKDEVTVVVGKDEFPTNIVPLTEKQFWDRYHD